MTEIKYVLIVSQYYYTHHCFVVRADEANFREKARTLVEKLEDVKRDNERPYYYGCSESDSFYPYVTARWNVNDVGDIYFIPCESVSEALYEAAEYSSYYKKEQVYNTCSKKQREYVENQVLQYHTYGKIKSVVESVFEVM